VLAVPGELVPVASTAMQSCGLGTRRRPGYRWPGAGSGVVPARTVSREHIARIVRCHAEAALGRAANGHQVVPVVDERWLLPSAVVIVHVPGIARCEAHVWCCARKDVMSPWAGCAVEQGRGRPGRPVPRVGVAVKSGSHALLCRRQDQTHDKGQVVARSTVVGGDQICRPIHRFPRHCRRPCTTRPWRKPQTRGLPCLPSSRWGTIGARNCTQTRSPVKVSLSPLES